MGDFEDVFGGGACGYDVVAGFGAQEYGYELAEYRSKQVIDHLIWFESYDSAVRWEAIHEGKSFTRRRRQGGFEVTIQAERRLGGLYRNRELRVNRNIESSVPPHLLLLQDDHAGRLVRNGNWSVRLAQRVDPVFWKLLRILQVGIPDGRIELSPICIPLSDFENACCSFEEPLAFDVNLGNNTFAAFAADHTMIIGKRDNQDIQIIPWVFKIPCNGRHLEETELGQCAICNYHTSYHLHLKKYFDPGLGEYVDVDFYDRQLTQEHYGSARSKANLASCVSDWLKILAPYSSKIGSCAQPPLTGRMQILPSGQQSALLGDLCSVLSRIIAVHENEECQVVVTLNLAENNLPQFSPGELEFKFTKAVCQSSRFKSFETSEIKNDASVLGPIPGWETFVNVDIPDQEMESHPLRSNSIISEGRFTTKGLSSHAKMEAMRASIELLGDDVPRYITEFLGEAFSQRLKPR